MAGALARIAGSRLALDAIDILEGLDQSRQGFLSDVQRRRARARRQQRNMPQPMNLGNAPKRRRAHNHATADRPLDEGNHDVRREIPATRTVPLSATQKAHRAYAAIESLLPRMKRVSYIAYNDVAEPARLTQLNHSPTTNTVGGYVYYMPYRDVTATGWMSLPQVWRYHTDKVKAVDGSASRYDPNLTPWRAEDFFTQIEPDRVDPGTMIFPISHCHTIQKGDNHDQRLTDFCDIKAIHLRGYLRAPRLIPHFRNTADTDYQSRGAWPDSVRFHPDLASREWRDGGCKFRLMIIQVATEADGDHTYNSKAWPATGTQALTVLEAPRLYELLDVVDEDDQNRFTGFRCDAIGKGYRPKSKPKTWFDPARERKIDFEVIHDEIIHVPGGSRYAIDKMIRIPGYAQRQNFPVRLSQDESALEAKINLEHGGDVLSDSAATTPTTAENSDRPMFMYLFHDRHYEYVDQLGGYYSQNCVLDIWGGKVKQDGLFGSLEDLRALCVLGSPTPQAHIRADIYFKDGV